MARTYHQLPTQPQSEFTPPTMMRGRWEADVMAAKIIESKLDALLDPTLAKWVDVLLVYSMTGKMAETCNSDEMAMEAWQWICNKPSRLSQFK